MEKTDLIRKTFSDSIECIVESCDQLYENIGKSSSLISSQLLEGNKIFCCGNGGAASDAQYFCSRLINRFDRERPALPAFCLSSDITTLTTIANDHNFNDIFSKQIRALANPGDILFVISNSGKSSNLIQAVQTAHEKQMFVIALSGNDGGSIEQNLTENDIELSVKNENSSRIKEVNLITMHCICELIDQNLFG